MDKKLDRLIELNEILVKQNNQIISLLVKLTDEEEIIENDDSSDIFDLKLETGEVLTVAESVNGDLNIYKISVCDSQNFEVEPSELYDDVKIYADEFTNQNIEITINNLTGNDITTQFYSALIVANHLHLLNIETELNIAILGNKNLDRIENLPEILRIAMENGAQKIYLPLKCAMEVVHAPPELMNHLEFYKNIENLLELF